MKKILLVTFCLQICFLSAQASQDLYPRLSNAQEDDITILNLFNSLQLDTNDFIYFDLSKYFSYDLETRPYWDISNYYGNTIKIKILEQ